MDKVRLSDEEWKEFQSIPDQGYSHRDWIEGQLTEHVEEAVKACATAFGDYISLLEKTHIIYANIVMDTEEDRELHARAVQKVDQALALVKKQLGLGGPGGVQEG